METGSDLKNRTAKGIGWGFVDNIMNTGFMALVNIVLARLLSPAEFGLVGMSTIFITLSNSLVDSGFTGALTRKKNAGEKDFNTVFYFNFGVSLLLYAVLYFCAVPISSFFRQPVLAQIIRIIGLSLIINALSIVQKVILIRKIDFRTQAIVSGISSVAAALSGIVLAVCGYGVWSLVVMQISRLAVNTVLLWIFSKWHPSFVFSFSSFREMFAFGGRLLLTSLVSTVWNEIYSLIIGRMYTPGILGQYNRAEKIKGMVTSNVSIVMQRVSYPVLSSVSDEREREIRVYRKVLKTTVIISFTLVLGMAATSEALVLTLIGGQWLQCVEYLRILCFSGIFLPLMICSANVINANGRSDITFYLELIKVASAGIPVLLGIFLSVEWLLWGIVAASFLSYMFHAMYVSKVIGYKVSEQFRDIFPILAISAVMALAVYALSFIDLPALPMLLLQISAGAGIVFAVYGLVYRCEEYEDIKGHLLGILRRK